jgi:cation diffusion facilitator family transporter
MVVELAAGWLSGSMALLADGWHMGSHAAALGLSVFAYRLSRRWRHDSRFTFGTGKVTSLAAYSSALLLGAGALWMLVESVTRLLQPVNIHYAEAMAVAALGLAVNVASAWLLSQGPTEHDHGHGPGHGHGHGHHHDRVADAKAPDHKDLNLRSAYLHVLADAMTSVLAITALSAGMFFGWAFLDPLMGIVGAALIGSWAWGLARESATTLVDAEDQGEMEDKIRDAIESVGDVQIADLHLWRVGAASQACILSIVTHDPRSADFYKGLLQHLSGLDHVTVEVHQHRNPHRQPRPN